MVCDRCEGTGNMDKVQPICITSSFTRCKKCFGTGEVNWIENVFGKQVTRLEKIITSLEDITNSPINTKFLDLNSLTPMVDYLFRYKNEHQ